MSTRSYFQFFAVILLFSLFTTQARGQQEIHHVPPVVNPDGYDPDLLQPLIEPMAFEPDFQFFAPADADFLDAEIESSVGWFGTYDRMWLYMSRPDRQTSFTQVDDGWGNRFDLGYMTSEDHGWLVTIQNLEGPNAYNYQEVERINVVEGRDTTTIPQGTVVLRGTAAAGNANATSTTLVVPVSDRNDWTLNQRAYQLRESLNVATYNSFELNKTFRCAPRHYGSVIEPFVGFRYMGYTDVFNNDEYSRFDTLTGALIFSTALGGTFPPPPVATVGIEQLDSVKSQFRNDMFGGQVGLRWFKQKSRWNLSGEVRAFAFQNFQALNTTVLTQRTVYSTGVAPSTVQAEIRNQDYFSAHSAEFVFGTEVRAEAAYDVTRYIQLRAGMQFVDLARGIGRGNNVAFNDQDVIMVGGTFGIAVNR